MAKIGSISELSIKLNFTYDSYLKVEATNERRLNKSDVKNVVNIVRNIGSSKDPDIIINAERVILRHEAQFYGTGNQQAVKSIDQAVKELDTAAKAMEIVKDKDKYQAANDTYSLKNRTTTGLPKDAFHDFTNSHKTRLGNRIRSIEASFEERLLLKERYNNMQIAQKEYMKLQAKALDINLPEKSREIER